MDTFIKFAVIFLEVLFAVGVIGSALVVILTSIEDMAEVFKSDEPSSVVRPEPSAAD